MLALMKGVGGKVFALDAIGVHVRFLVAIPLFFLCETWVGPRMTEFVRDIVSNGVVPESGRPALVAVIRRVDRLKDPWLVEVLFLLLVIAFVLVEPLLNIPGRTGNWELLLTESGGTGGPVLRWYFWFCLPLFRFLLLRWMWHLALWCYFLWRVQRLDLHLVPTHPDRAAGLGYLEVVQEHFSTLVIAFSAVLSATYAEGLASGAMAFEALYRQIPLALLLVALLFIGPLFIFSFKLWDRRITEVDQGREPFRRSPAGHTGHAVAGGSEQQRYGRAGTELRAREPQAGAGAGGVRDPADVPAGLFQISGQRCGGPAVPDADGIVGE
jgi:hypothetical protein